MLFNNIYQHRKNIHFTYIGKCYVWFIPYKIGMAAYGKLNQFSQYTKLRFMTWHLLYATTNHRISLVSLLQTNAGTHMSTFITILIVFSWIYCKIVEQSFVSPRQNLNSVCCSQGRFNCFHIFSIWLSFSNNFLCIQHQIISILRVQRENRTCTDERRKQTKYCIHR